MTSGHVSDGAMVLRVLAGFGLAYVLGFERELRGSAAGTRTFALVGLTSTCVAVVTSATPQALAGIITGVGFIGGGVILHNQNSSTDRGTGSGSGSVTGITTASTIFAAAGSGLVIGTGHLLLGALTTCLVLLVLELPHIRLLAFLDGQQYAARFRPDRGSPTDRPHP